MTEATFVDEDTLDALEEIAHPLNQQLIAAGKEGICSYGFADEGRPYFGFRSEEARAAFKELAGKLNPTSEHGRWFNGTRPIYCVVEKSDARTQPRP